MSLSASCRKGFYSGREKTKMEKQLIAGSSLHWEPRDPYMARLENESVLPMLCTLLHQATIINKRHNVISSPAFSWAWRLSAKQARTVKNCNLLKAQYWFGESTSESFGSGGQGCPPSPFTAKSARTSFFTPPPDLPVSVVSLPVTQVQNPSPGTPFHSFIFN